MDIVRLRRKFRILKKLCWHVNWWWWSEYKFSILFDGGDIECAKRWHEWQSKGVEWWNKEKRFNSLRLKQDVFKTYSCFFFIALIIQLRMQAPLYNKLCSFFLPLSLFISTKEQKATDPIAQKWNDTLQTVNSWRCKRE